MSKPIHTPGPVETNNRAAGCKNGGLYWQILESRKDEAGARKIIASGMADGDARLLAAAYNAFDSTAKKLGVNAVELAERMQEGEIARLVGAIEQLMWQVVNGTPAEHGNAAIEARAILAKVKGGVA